MRTFSSYLVDRTTSCSTGESSVHAARRSSSSVRTLLALVSMASSRIWASRRISPGSELERRSWNSAKTLRLFPVTLRAEVSTGLQRMQLDALVDDSLLEEVCGGERSGTDFINSRRRGANRSRCFAVTARPSC